MPLRNFLPALLRPAACGCTPLPRRQFGVDDETVSHAGKWAAESGSNVASVASSSNAHGDPTKAWARWRDDINHDLSSALDGRARTAADLLADGRPQPPDGWHDEAIFLVDADGAHHTDAACHLLGRGAHEVRETVAEVGELACVCAAESRGGPIGPDHLGYRKWKATGPDLLSACRRTLESIRDDDHIDVDAVVATLAASSAHSADAPWDNRTLVAAHAVVEAAAERALSDGTADAALWTATMCVQLDQMTHDRAASRRVRTAAADVRDHLLAGRDPNRAATSVRRARQVAAHDAFTAAHNRTTAVLRDLQAPAHASAGFTLAWDGETEADAAPEGGLLPFLPAGAAPAFLRWPHLDAFPISRLVGASFVRVAQFDLPEGVDEAAFYPRPTDSPAAIPVARHRCLDAFIELVDRLGKGR